jgi:hypothetical protein
MTYYSFPVRLTVMGFLCLSVALAQSPMPVSELTMNQVANLNLTVLPLDQLDFKTSALVQVASQPSLTQTNVDRQSQATAAAYAGVGVPYSPAVTPGPALSGTPPGGSVFDFKKSGNSSQGWATMTSDGKPFLFLNSFGKASAQATASWRAHIVVPAGDTKIYVFFSLPAAEVDGFTEMNGPSPYQDRLRAELLLNGHPVWNSEQSRFSEVDQAGANQNCQNGSETANRLTVYGKSLGLSASNPGKNSTAKQYIVSIGSLQGSQALDLTLVVRSDTQVKYQCCPHNADNQPEFFCTRATALLTWTQGLKPVQFKVGP